MGSYKPVNAVIRGLDVLAAVNKLRGRATVGELHRETGLDKATIVRMLETLAHAGYIFRDGERVDYEVTGRALLLCSGYDRHRAVGRAVAPIIGAFRNRVGWPSDVAVFDRDAMVVVETSRIPGQMFVIRDPGFRSPMLGTSLGLAYLAFTSDEEQAAVLTREAEVPAPWNAMARDPAEAARVLGAIRARGYATMHEDFSRLEYRRQISTLGVPILISGRSVAAMNVLYLKSTLTAEDAVKNMLAPLQACAAEVSAALS